MAISHPVRIFTLTTLAMIAFAGNSLLCRLALKNTAIDAASFTSIRLISGALALWLIMCVRNDNTLNGNTLSAGNWLSALALFAYAAGFSFAYLSLTAATGALLLFGAVQVTMISHGISKGERIHGLSLLGFLFALLGFVGLLLPGLSAPPLIGSVLMSGAGVAWGVYSLRGKTAGDPIKITAGNFLRAAMIAILFSLVMFDKQNLDSSGIAYAVCSGAITSGIGYVIWYSALPALKASSAAVMQLSVPMLTALGGVAFLGESINMRLGLASAAILGGIALVIFHKQEK